MLVSFVLGNFTILSLCLLILTVKTTRQSTAREEAPLEIASQEALPKLPPLNVLGAAAEAKVVTGDAAAELVEAFLIKYASPMAGLGEKIVAAARKYQIPFGLLPAIGQCEGNLGKSIPTESFNTWGYGIYGGQIVRFSNWQEAIDTVSKGIRTNYFDYGLTTPEKMMTKYAPPSNGSWAYCVNKFLRELQ